MLLAGEDSIREIIPFPMNKNAQDVMMSAPSEVTQKQLDELHIAIVKAPGLTCKSGIKKRRTAFLRSASFFHFPTSSHAYHLHDSGGQSLSNRWPWVLHQKWSSARPET